ncbi:MAG: hypothetical protein JRI23_23750 [Deltaproteobacteria bacterium]|nr:hypothetical protein [Deltaproteobacteria bacterium]MBW2535007.1 hypothetical protein [Deltaproteobacteria bacterium]
MLISLHYRRPRAALVASSTALLLGLSVAPRAARSDPVPEPPKACPEGAVPATGHGGPYCAVHHCKPDCTDGRPCVTRSLCIVESEVTHRGGSYTLVEVEGPCNAGGVCAAGSCRTFSVCPPAPTLLSRCGCRVGQPGGARWPALLLLLGVAAGRRRARSRR